jgi:hypothetical protein
MADEFDPIERQKETLLREQGCEGPRKQMAALRKKQAEALEYVELLFADAPDQARLAELEADALVRFSYLDAVLNVTIPATKLWNTGVGANFLREAISLMGGYGITEDCPGFLMHKWADSQLEATYEGPEAVQRMHLTVTMSNPVFLAALDKKADQLEASGRPGAAALAEGLRSWLWTHQFLASGKDAEGKKLLHRKRQGVSFPLADALCWLVSAVSLMDDVAELIEKGPMNPTVAEGLEGLSGFYNDLAFVQVARATGEAGRILAELVYGFAAEGDTAPFAALRASTDAKLAGSRLAKDRASEALAGVMIPEALDYPL